MKSLKRTMLARIKEKRERARVDYLDWYDIPKSYNFVAIDAVDSLDSTGRVVFQAGRPVAYSDEVHQGLDGRWVFTAQKPGDRPKPRPLYVAAAAIIGPLPAPENSLRKRPGA